MAVARASIARRPGYECAMINRTCHAISAIQPVVHGQHYGDGCQDPQYRSPGLAVEGGGLTLAVGTGPVLPVTAVGSLDDRSRERRADEP